MASVSNLFSIFAAALYAAACLGAGYGVSRMGFGHASDALEKEHGLAATAGYFLLGTVVLNFGLTALGLLGMLRPVPILLLLALGFGGLLLQRHAMRGVPERLAAWWQAWREEPTSIQALACITAIVAIGFGAAALVSPPIGDAEAFYIAYAKIMSSTGRLDPMPGTYEFFSTIGLPAELHFTALMVLKDTHAAKLLVWPVALACAVFLAAITGACGGGKKARLFATVILFSSSTFTQYIADGKVDLFAAAFGLAALYWAIVPAGEKSPRCHAPLIGLFAGAATVAKFSYLLTLGPALVILLIWRIHDGHLQSAKAAWRETLRVAVLVFATACIPWIPQLIKNGVMFGAPLSPFIGGPQDTSWLQQIWFSPEVTRHIVLTYPLALIFGRYPMQGGGLSLLMLAFAPLVFFLSKPGSIRSSTLTWIAIAALASTVVWIIFRPSVIAPRYILATLLLLVPLVAIAAEKFWESACSTRLLRAGMLTAIAAAFAAPSYHLLPIPGLLLAYASGRAEPCALASESCKPLQEVSRIAMAGDRVFIASYYGYWLRPDLLQCRDMPAEHQAVKGAQDVITALTDRGFRFLVVDRSTHAWPIKRIESNSALDTRLKPIFSTLNISVFELPSVSGQALTARCNEVAPGEWKIQPIYKNK